MTATAEALKDRLATTGWAFIAAGETTSRWASPCGRWEAHVRTTSARRFASLQLFRVLPGGGLSSRLVIRRADDAIAMLRLDAVAALEAEDEARREQARQWSSEGDR